MFTKYKLQTMGFDKADQSKSYQQMLEGLEPGESDNFVSAYSCGLGMLVDFHQQYARQVSDDSFYTPSVS